MVRFRHPGQTEGLLGGGEAQLWQVGMEGHADTAIPHLPKDRNSLAKAEYMIQKVSK